MDELIKRIEAALKTSGMTHDELAMRADVSRQTLWRILSRVTKRPHKATLLRLSKTLNLPDTTLKEALSGQYEMLQVSERLPEDDELFKKALCAQLDSVPERLRLEAVRAALVSMAGVVQQSKSPTEDGYHVLRSMEKSRWQARVRRRSPAPP
ncbi:MAG TPA: helix-turn-helix transcriptional regulator [Longimicrobium sp.]|nr:helix-turn-helix transcriptional regulator [Longimicrobium sp.]